MWASPGLRVFLASGVAMPSSLKIYLHQGLPKDWGPPEEIFLYTIIMDLFTDTFGACWPVGRTQGIWERTSHVERRSLSRRCQIQPQDLKIWAGRCSGQSKAARSWPCCTCEPWEESSVLCDLSHPTDKEACALSGIPYWPPDPTHCLLFKVLLEHSHSLTCGSRQPYYQWLSCAVVWVWQRP